jgi:CRP-like cAMP-binding protein
MVVRNDIDKYKIAESIGVLWEPLTEEQRSNFIANITIHEYRKNENIFCSGDTPSHLMCLISGKVKIYRESTGGRSQIVRMVNEMGFFAYRAAFSNENYIMSASAFEPSVVCLIPIEVIKQLIRANNSIAIYFIKQLSDMLGLADMRLISLTQKHIRGRLAESLIALKDKYGVEEDGSTLSIYLSREDLASLSNMTTSNAIRTLSSFAAENLIAIDGRKIKIIEDEELRKVSKFG